MPMVPDQWERVQSVFLSLVDLSPAEQAGLLTRECGEDAQLRAEVESLLSSDRGSVEVISAAIADEAALLAGVPDSQDDANPLPAMDGRLVGQWRLLRELGHGGMGAVYLAARADQQYESQAAIKLVRRGLDTDFILRRFRRERQILARLEHPNITRMFDGGTTDDEVPYFVMEYVDGLWITRYAAEHKLSVEERIRLFLPVCAAVAYAHRNFIVHRDLKPSNILIDTNGIPKLLDFGISKLLHSDQPDSGNTQGVGMMTPDYASPEQILGDPVTVASDVYSLGTVLYELLTGARPHRIERCTPLALERAICLDPVLAPSVAAAADRALARRLKGDLDNIILCAIQKEPARRYASVELLAEDLQRFLEHRPVTARPDSTAYRIGKFIRRNRLSVALGAVATLAVLTGAVVARQQAIVAHQHFQDVRKLASAFVFDVEDAVRPLPGSTRVRQLIARTGVEYLNRLSRSSARDWNLKRELASAWVRIGTVQGGENSSNLGDPGAALISFGNAGQLLDEVLRHDPSDAKAAFDRMKLFYEMSDLQWTLGRYKEAITSAEAGLRLAESRMSADAKDFETMRYAGLLHLALVRLHQQDGNLNAAEAEAAAGSRLVHLAAQASPDNRDTQLSLSELAARVGNVEAYRRRQDAALASYRSGVTVLEGLCRRYPQDTLIRHDLMIAYSHVGDTLGNFNLHYKNPSDLPGAFQAYAKMAEQAKFLYDADPADVRALADYGISLMRVGRVTAPAGPLRRATLERSLGLLNRAAAATPGNRMIATHIVWLDNELGEYAAAIVKAEASVGGKSVDLAMVLLLEKAVRGLSEAQARHRQREDALATLDHSMRWARSTNASGPQTSTTLILTAHAWQTSGSVYKILAGAETGERASEDRETARASYSKALAAWQKLEQAGTTLAPIESERKDAERALAPGGLESKRRSER